MDTDDYIKAHITIPAEAFDELLDDLDTPARPSPLRQLMLTDASLTEQK